MKRFSVFGQLYVALLIVLIIPTSLIAFYATNSIEKYSESYIAESTLDNVESVSNTVEVLLENYSKSVIQFASGRAYKNLRKIPDYATLNSDYEMVSIAWEAQNSLNKIFAAEQIVQSAFYIGSEGDYVISTDRGICKLENYHNLDWLKQAVKDETGITGKWIVRTTTNSLSNDMEPSDDNASVTILSYIYNVNPLITSSKGTLVCNVYMTNLSKLMNSNKMKNGSCYVLDETGNVIGKPDKTVITLDRRDIEQAYDNHIAQNSQTDSYFYYDNENVRYLCAYRKSDFNGWTYLVIYNLDALMSQSKNTTLHATLLIIMVITLGTLLVFLLSNYVLRPFRKLMGDVRESTVESEQGMNPVRNEVIYLNNVFDKMKQQEMEVHKILEEKKSDAQRLHLKDILLGTFESKEIRQELKQCFPYDHFMVILANVDDGGQLLRKLSSDERMYYFMQIEDMMNHSFQAEGYVAKAVRLRSTTCALVLNIRCYDQCKVSDYIKETLEQIKKEIQLLFQNTMTMGVSGVHSDLEDLNECTTEALTAVNHRIISGKNQIIFWNEHMGTSKRFYYSYTVEKKIVNCLKLNNLDAAIEEIKHLRDGIMAIENISYDNVSLIYQQIISAIVRTFVEEQIDTSGVLENASQAYRMIAEKDTAEEMENYIIDFLHDTRNVLGIKEDDREEEHVYTKIIHFLEEHYKEDIDFEGMAKEMGISYSYMRRLVKENSGSSMADYVNRMRIHEAKKLLHTTTLRVAAIAELVGYHNVQSINRFFKKYEGASPNEIRNLRKEIV